MADVSSDTDSDSNCSGNDWELVPSDGSPLFPVSSPIIGLDEEAVRLVSDAGEPLQLDYFGASLASMGKPFH